MKASVSLPSERTISPLCVSCARSLPLPQRSCSLLTGVLGGVWAVRHESRHLCYVFFAGTGRRIGALGASLMFTACHLRVHTSVRVCVPAAFAAILLWKSCLV